MNVRDGGGPVRLMRGIRSQIQSPPTLIYINWLSGPSHRISPVQSFQLPSEPSAMTVGTVCNRDVVYTTPQTSAAEAARLMRQYHVGNLIVAEEKAGKRLPVGIVTDRDLVIEVMAQGISPVTVTVADMMSATLITAQESDDLMDTIKRMRAKGIRRIPVVGADSALVGILSVDDVIDLLAEELTDLARLITREQRREQRRRT